VDLEECRKLVHGCPIEVLINQTRHLLIGQATDDTSRYLCLRAVATMGPLARGAGTWQEGSTALSAISTCTRRTK
jgi:hypothetical protein